MRWLERISRCRDRLFCFRAEAVRRDSLSRRRASWEIRASRLEGEDLLVVEEGNERGKVEVLVPGGLRFGIRISARLRLALGVYWSLVRTGNKCGTACRSACSVNIARRVFFEDGPYLSL